MAVKAGCPVGLRCFRGIDTPSAAGLCAEVGSFARFPRPELAGFLWEAATLADRLEVTVVVAAATVARPRQPPRPRRRSAFCRR